MKVIQRKAMFLGTFISLVLAVGCSKTTSHQHFGEAIDPNAPKITLAELVAKPQTWDGKTVVVDGQFAGKCGDGDFYFRDKFDIIEADPPDPKVCLLNKGTAVRVYGLVKTRTTAANEASEAGEPKEAGKSHSDVTVRLAVKGVEVQ